MNRRVIGLNVRIHGLPGGEPSGFEPNINSLGEFVERGGKKFGPANEHERIYGGRWETVGVRGNSAATASAAILPAMTEQEIADFFAKAAKPRLLDLLRLKVRHV